MPLVFRAAPIRSDLPDRRGFLDSDDEIPIPSRAGCRSQPASNRAVKSVSRPLRSPRRSRSRDRDAARPSTLSPRCGPRPPVARKQVGEGRPYTGQTARKSTYNPTTAKKTVGKKRKIHSNLVTVSASTGNESIINSLSRLYLCSFPQ
ncbi:hypothetical protein RvY_19029-3 [Ramazzottius varieornatus]|uniref:Uncharacterized protein n=1 Tax=Ramazzottius varieornatus TaxID=947166 RepID=A0A1D1W850_RAMVA|nr:hypothetical protein RvY_19029-3 [Ramazzottius varieornatus]